jgi:hypothetical protein
VHEFYYIEGGSAHTACPFFAVLEKDTAILDLDDSRVGDGNPEDVRSQILDAMFLSQYGLGAVVPVFLPATPDL